MSVHSGLRNKKVLITGAGGFIGSHLTESLLKITGKVSAFVHYNSRNNWGFLEELSADVKSNIDIVFADLRDYHAVNNATKQVDVVFHLGALIGIPYSIASPFDVVESNVTGALNILKASLENGVSKIIHTSTSEVYGTAQYAPIDEDHPLRPQSPYAASKIAADKLAESFFLSYNLPVTILRPFNTYGPRQSLRAVIPTVISHLNGANRVVVGNLEPRRDFTFVSDTVRGFIMTAEKSGIDGETFNLGTRKDIS
ncbi:NAD-dependent epimerase/dehydratase family protein, partial [bacterium]|nr:NAD-dependent epimerase/dehydratase family protein [bacterium]